MKKIFSLMLFVGLLSSNCFAMILEQPLKVGYIGTHPQSPIGGVGIQDASYNRGNYYTHLKKNNTDTYEKGVARCGKGDTTLYCHYDNGGYILKFGGENIFNTIKFDGYSADIEKIENDVGKIIYVLCHYSVSHATGSVSYSVIGQQYDGNWVNYFSVSGKFNPRVNDYPPAPSKFYCKDDTIIIEYKDYRAGKNVYEMRYKWDDKAQWFGVEQVVY